ncbi:TetR/AcrR family transcriptional regulator [Actinomycetospora sp. NBRC 106378]|uniref:TetR/AcrR family transcriptional regulator n=1 Tax=Actinomycetospora sp. NBRC 106378 TaxID=3032208 RepID=UPI0025523EDA|nr:TetR/AcrR family transcriptional regulator [Actinomycetospora sp. NBRC 106378]
MSRYAAEHKKATRRRIVESSGLRFRQDGFDGSGIATLMKDAGLTNGAFYAHFASKDDLIAHVIADTLQTQADVYRGVDGRDGLACVVRAYLSGEHRDARREGCPSAALLGEIDRSSPAARAAYTAGIVGLADVVAAHLEPDEPGRLRVRVLGALAALFGTLQLARAVDDPALAEELLDQGQRDVLAMLDLDDEAAR